MMDIDKSKENIQPLRGGRNVMQLSTALQAQSDGDAQKQLILQKAEHEANIRNYVGPDPLDVWFSYIQWLEQSFPKHGHEGSIDKALKSCLTEFENDPRYVQDKRFIRLWIKYIDYQNNPLELYQLLYNKGVGTMCSELYRAWACYCEEANDYAKADQVYNMGLQAHSQPMDELLQAHKNFQLWFAQRYFHDDSPTKRKAASALAETRLALTSLRTIKRRNIAVAPSQRTGDNVKSLNPGVVRNHPSAGAGSASQPHTNIMVNICQDNPGPSGMVGSAPIAQPTEPVTQSIIQTCGQEENLKEVGMWTNPLSKSGKLGTMSRPAVTTSVPFEIFQEDGINLPSNHVPYCMEDLSSFKIPLTLPEPDDPTKIRKYNKKEVYRDGEEGSVEFSLEEIKSRKYLAAFKKTRPSVVPNTANHNIDNNFNTRPKNSNSNALQTLATCATTSGSLESNEYVQNKYLRQEDKKDGETNNYDIPVSSEFNLENIIAQSNSILNAEDPHQSVVLEQNEGYTVEYIDMCKQQYEGVDKNTNNVQNSDVPSSYIENNHLQYGPKKSVYADFNRSLLANVHDDSMTVHTREANREVNNAFARPVVGHDDSVTSLVVPPVTQFQFNICEDQSIAVPSQKPNNQITEECAKINDGNVPSGYANYQQQKPIQHQQPAKINFDETCSTQMFNFNVHQSSTPIANQFKKPFTVDPTKAMNIKKFNISDAENIPSHNAGEVLNGPYNKGKENPQGDMQYPEHNGLSTIMETTEQRSSGSSSSGSYQTTRNTMYTARESCGQSLGVINEKSSHIEGQHQVDHNMYRRMHHSRSQQSVHNATANYNMSADNKTSSTQSYHAIDHPYHKTPTSSYNGYNMQQRNNNSSMQMYHQQQQHTMHQNNSSYSSSNYQQASGGTNAYQPQANGSYPQQQPSAYQQQSPASGYHHQANTSYQQQPNTYQPQANASYHQQNYMNYQQPSYNQQQTGYNAGYHQQQPLQSPQGAGFQSPSHNVQPGFQSPQQPIPSPQQGFTSPQQGFTSPQQGFSSPQQGFASPQHGYASPQQPYASYAHTPQQHVYAARPQHHQGYASPNVNQGGFQSPPHAVQGYPSPHQGFQTSAQQAYHHNSQTMNNSYHQPQMNNHNTTADRSQYQQNKPHQTSYHNQSQNFNNQSSYQGINYQNQTKQQNVNAYNNGLPNNTVQQSPAFANNSYKYQQQQRNINSNSSSASSASSATTNNNVSHNSYTPNANSQEYNGTPTSQSQYQSYSSTSTNVQQQPTVPPTSEAPQTNQLNQMYSNTGQQKPSYPTPQVLASNKLGPKPPYQSPTSKLRSVRHEVPHATPKVTTNTSPAANPGFSNQFLNFISARNEPKDNANTPKFGHSPNISQKMHKNLYVSSPEQGQVPPNTDMNASEISKQNSVCVTSESQHSISQQSITNKQKDQSKRQLDFENRTEIQNEDSRDSITKTSRKSSNNSRPSARSTANDNCQMDVDSENSMDCQTMTFKSNTSNTQLSTQEIPKPAVVDFPKVIDPFSRDLNNALMQYVKFPNKNHYKGYYDVKNIPKYGLNTIITLAESNYSMEKLLGRGTFGCVYRALDCTTKTSVAVKYQKPGNPWEYYICKEIRARIDDSYVLYGYMDIQSAFFSEHASIFVSELSRFGSLLDVANKVKQATAKSINEFIVMLLASEMITIVHYLHKSEIIHADIKPDNFLLMDIPQMDSRYPSLQLIDFGCAIDMSLYPKGTTFKKVISTEGFTCNEMREGKCWTYQTDLYCLAGTIFLVLMGKYMQTVDCGGKRNAEKKWPRYMKSFIWDKLFLTLLNIKDCDSIPDLMELKSMLDDYLRTEGGSAVNNQLNTLANVLKSR